MQTFKSFEWVPGEELAEGGKFHLHYKSLQLSFSHCSTPIASFTESQVQESLDIKIILDFIIYCFDDTVNHGAFSSCKFQLL